MTTPSSGRTRAFISYSHSDRRYLERLQKHLAYYAQKGIIDFWDDTKIKPGSRWKEDIKKTIDSAGVALLLVSADFLASEFITHDELPPLLAAAKEEGAMILSVILSHCSFNHSELAQFQAVNPPSKPLIGMPKAKQEELWAYVAECVKDALSGNLIALSQHPESQPFVAIPPQAPQKTVEEWLEEAESYQDEQPVPMLFASEQALQLDPDNAQAFYFKGEAHSMLDENDKALTAYNRAIELDPTDVSVYLSKYYTLMRMSKEQYNKALNCCIFAIRQIPDEDSMIEWTVRMADMVLELEQYEQALSLYQQALSYLPGRKNRYTSTGISKGRIYKHMSDALFYLVLQSQM